MSLDLAQCARCRRVFPRVKSPVCPDCQRDEDADLASIKKIIEAEPGLSPEEVADRAQVPVDCVFRMMDEGLITNEAATEKFRCAQCGKPSTGRGKRLCQDCLDKLDARFSQAVSATRMNIRLRDEGAGHVREAVEEKRRSGKPGLFRRDPNSQEK